MGEKLLREWVRQKILLETSFATISGGEKGKQFSVQQQLMDPSYTDLRDEVIDLINTAYAYTGGNYDYKAADDLMNNNDLGWSYAWDLDADPDPDVGGGGGLGRGRGGALGLLWECSGECSGSAPGVLINNRIIILYLIYT